MTSVRQYFPAEQLRPYIKYFIISERKREGTYKVIPSSGPVIGLQYSGHLSTLVNNEKIRLNSAEITGLSDGYRIFSSSANIGTILIYFSATGFAHFASHPADKLFNLSLSLEDVFRPPIVSELKERLVFAISDEQRIGIVEQFLISQMNNQPTDKLVAEAVALIMQSNGTLRMKRLSGALFTSQSPLEKRFKRIVGTSPKKFASIVRFNHIIGRLNGAKSLNELSCESDFYDQAHFSKGFKQYTGVSPEEFKSTLVKARFFATTESRSPATRKPNLRVQAVETL